MVDLPGQYSHIKETVDASISEVLNSAAYINGPFVKEFQADLEKYLDVKHVIPCANGTDALQIALMSIGIKKDDERISELSIVPKGGRVLKTISLAIPVVLIGLLGWFAYNGDLASIKENGIYWFAGNFIGAALFCMLAGGHPIAILVAALASPITSLNPALAAGWFAGYAQMKVKEPTGEDLTEFLKLDSAKLFWTNRAGRILLVTALTNLGSMAGAWISMALIAAGL